MNFSALYTGITILTNSFIKGTPIIINVYKQISFRQTKLKENLYSDEIIDLVIDYLKGYKYIDDVAYATLYFET